MNPHGATPLEHFGVSLDEAEQIAVVLHGRGQDPNWMRENLIERVSVGGVAYVAPTAKDHTWYPGGFMEPTEVNQPSLDWALELVGTVVSELASGAADRPLHLMGFSQGACLAAQYTALNPSAVSGLVVLTGGLIGPPGTTWPMAPAPQLRCVIATSDVDDWVPLPRVEETRDVFVSSGAHVDWQLYVGMGHEICDDEIARVDALLATFQND